MKFMQNSLLHTQSHAAPLPLVLAQVISFEGTLEGLQVEFERQGEGSEQEILSAPVPAHPGPPAAPPGDAHEDPGQPSSDDDDEATGALEGSQDEEIEETHTGSSAALQQGTPLGNVQQIVGPSAEAPSGASGGGFLEGLGLTDSVDMEMHEHVRQELALVLGNMVLGSRLSSNIHRSSPPSSTNEQQVHRGSPLQPAGQSVSQAPIPSMQPIRPTSVPRQMGRPSSQSVRSRSVQRAQSTSAFEPTPAITQRQPASKDLSSSKAVRSASPASSTRQPPPSFLFKSPVRTRAKSAAPSPVTRSKPSPAASPARSAATTARSPTRSSALSSKSDKGRSSQTRSPSVTPPPVAWMSDTSTLQREVIDLKAQLLQLQASIAATASSTRSEGGRETSVDAGGGEGDSSLGRESARALLAELQRALRAKMAELMLARDGGSKRQGAHSLPQAEDSLVSSSTARAVTPTSRPRPAIRHSVEPRPPESQGQGHAEGSISKAPPAAMTSKGGDGGRGRRRSLSSSAATRPLLESLSPLLSSPSLVPQSTNRLVRVEGNAPSSARRRLQQLLGITPSVNTQERSAANVGSTLLQATHAPTGRRRSTPTRGTADRTPAASGFVTELESPSCASPRISSSLAAIRRRQGVSVQQSSSSFRNAQGSILAAVTPPPRPVLSSRFTDENGPAGQTERDLSAGLAEPAELPPSAQKQWPLTEFQRGSGTALVSVHSGQGGASGLDVEAAASKTPALVSRPADSEVSIATTQSTPASALQAQHSGLSIGGSGNSKHVSRSTAPAPASSTLRVRRSSTPLSARFSPEVLAKASAVAYPTASTLGLTGSLSRELVNGIAGDSTGGEKAGAGGQQSGGISLASVMITPCLQPDGGDKAPGREDVTFRLTVVDSTLTDAGTPVTVFGGSGGLRGGTRRGSSASWREDRALQVHTLRSRSPGRGPQDEEGSPPAAAVWDSPGKGHKVFAPAPCFYPSGVGPMPTALQYCVTREEMAVDETGTVVLRIEGIDRKGRESFA